MGLSYDTLLSFLGDELAVDVVDVRPNTPLFSGGLIDSFSLVSLMTFIEQEGKITIQPTDVNLDNFDSLSNIMTFLGKKSAVKHQVF